MKLTYFGHCAFRWQTPGGVTVVADPYRNQAGRYWFTRLFPELRCDLGLITHAHFDHDAVDRLPEAASILRTPGDFSTRDLQIRGVQDLHSGASRLRDFPNVMFRLESGGLRFLHIGDNRVDWPEDVSTIGDIDVLMVTVTTPTTCSPTIRWTPSCSASNPASSSPCTTPSPACTQRNVNCSRPKDGCPDNRKSAASKPTRSSSPRRNCRPSPRSGCSSRPPHR